MDKKISAGQKFGWLQEKAHGSLRPPLFRVFATWIIYLAGSSRVRANNEKTCFHDRLTIRRFGKNKIGWSVRNGHV